MNIRPATANDKTEWLRMRQCLWPDCSGQRHALEMEQIWESSGVVLMAHREDESVCGFIEVSVRNDHVPGALATPIAYVEGWYVDTDCRRQGIGHQLLASAEEWARSRSFEEIASDSVVDNEPSIRAHLAFGFREVSREVHFIKSLVSD